MKATELRQAGARIRVAGVVLGAVFAILAARAAHLSVIDERGRDRGNAQTGTVLRLAPARGLIVDRHGAELAVTMHEPSVYAVPRQISDPDATAVALQKILGIPASRLRERLTRSSPFVFLARWTGQERADRILALELDGIGIVAEPRRTYPGGSLAGRYLGFANIDGAGARGIEQAEDEWLAGKPQRVAVERDAHQKLLAHAGVDPRAAAGGDVALTLDAALQSVVEADLTDVVKLTGAKGGLVVVMDPRSGDLLAVAEHPQFDPNQFRTTPYTETRSLAFHDAEEPGSTQKAFVVAAALEHGVLGTEELIDCENGSFRVPGKTLRDTHAHGLLDPAGILRVSSNICAAKIGFRVGPERHYAMLRALGFGQPTGSGFPDESAGLLRRWDRWRTVDHATVSFGQGMNATAIQMATAMSTLAADGVQRTPRLVAARRAPGGRWEDRPPEHGRRILRPEVAQRLVGMLETVVGPEGTGKYAGLDGIRVAGKTGTAQKLEPDGTYSQKRYRAWFMGLAPADAPELVIVVQLDEPRGVGHSGGATAAPLFARAATAALARRGIVTKPERDLPVWAHWDWKPDAPPKHKIAARRPPPPATPRADAAPPPRPPERAPTAVRFAQLGDRWLLPDLRGLTRDQVKSITAALPLRVKLLGSGRAVSQKPAPGTVLASRSGTVNVRFEAR